MMQAWEILPVPTRLESTYCCQDIMLWGFTSEERVGEAWRERTKRGFFFFFSLWKNSANKWQEGKKKKKKKKRKEKIFFCCCSHKNFPEGCSADDSLQSFSRIRNPSNQR